MKKVWSSLNKWFSFQSNMLQRQDLQTFAYHNTTRLKEHIKRKRGRPIETLRRPIQKEMKKTGHGVNSNIGPKTWFWRSGWLPSMETSKYLAIYYDHCIYLPSDLLTFHLYSCVLNHPSFSSLLCNLEPILLVYYYNLKNSFIYTTKTIQL